MVRRRLICPECRLWVFLNSVKCGGCNCSFHAGAEKCARIDTANWSESWCCPDCSSKKMPINKVNPLNSPVLPSPRTPRSPNSRAKMLNILKELKSPVLPPSQKSTLASPYLQHEVTPPPSWSFLSDWVPDLFFRRPILYSEHHHWKITNLLTWGISSDRTLLICYQRKFDISKSLC